MLVHWRVLMLGSLCYFKPSINVQKGSVMGRAAQLWWGCGTTQPLCLFIFWCWHNDRCRNLHLKCIWEIYRTDSKLFVSYFWTKYGGLILGELVLAQACSWSNQKQMRVQHRLNCDVPFMFGMKWYTVSYLKWTGHRTLLIPNKLFNIFYFQVYFNHRRSKFTGFQNRVIVEYACYVNV